MQFVARRENVIFSSVNHISRIVAWFVHMRRGVQLSALLALFYDEPVHVTDCANRPFLPHDALYASSVGNMPRHIYVSVSHTHDVIILVRYSSFVY